MTTNGRRVSLSILFVASAGALLAPSDVRAQARDAGYTRSGAADLLSAPRKVWEDRGPIQDRDLYWGSGSPDRAPVNPFTFVREDTAATNPKAVLRDANGTLWGVKWDDEAQGEVAATRLAWAMGLGVEETYYVPAGTVSFPGGRPAFQRINSFIDKSGRFTSGARFERRDPERVSKGTWPFRRNPVMSDPGYEVLLLMNVVMGNWDAKDDNTKLVSLNGPGGPVDWYLISDYGACFGKMGGEFSHSKYRLKDFSASPPVISGISGGRVFLAYKGKNEPFHESVSIEGARLFAKQAANLRLEQVEDAFRAAEASDADRRGFARLVYTRIRQIVAAVQ
jgi:hypothetical protein